MAVSLLKGDLYDSSHSIINTLVTSMTYDIEIFDCLVMEASINSNFSAVVGNLK